MGAVGSREGQSLPLLPVVPLAASLVVGLRTEPLWRGCRTPGPISCGGKAALLLACQALSPMAGVAY
jgi:hypothetical protein